MAWLSLKFDPPLSGLDQSIFEVIPGVKFKGAYVGCSDHALPIVESMATELGKRVITFRRPSPPPTLDHIPLLRSWVGPFMTNYQKTGVAHAITEWNDSNQSGMFMWSPGSGKTLGGIAWACAAGENSRTVVITKTAVRMQYRDEIERFSEASAEAIEGQVPTALPSKGFVVLGHEILPHWVNELVRWRPDSVIFDESHRLKNRKRFDAIVEKNEQTTFRRKNNQAGAAFVLSRAVRRRLATTATPIRDRVRDLWAQLDILRPGEFGSYLGPKIDRVKTPDKMPTGFGWRYCAAYEDAFGGVDDRGSSHLDELRARLAYVMHVVPFSVANRELPPARRLVTLVRVGEQNRPGPIAEDIRNAARSGRRSAIIEARLWEAASRKRKRIGDLVELAVDNKQKVIIFTGRRRDCEDLEREVLSRVPDDTPVWMAHGGDSDVRRREIQKSYMASPGPAVLIGTIDAWGEGLDLQDTDLLLVAMLPYTPGQIIQLEGRVVRLGMKRPTLIQYLIAESTIDEHVAQILLRKLPAVEKTIDADEVRGIANELAGADDDTLIAELAATIEQGAA